MKHCSKSTMDSHVLDTDITLEHSTTVERTIQGSINRYYNNREKIEMRLQELDNEWDIERALQLTAASLSLTGLALAVSQNKKWLFLPLAISGFLMNHALVGWCPPLPLLRAMGLRNRAEIDKEKYALKALRGDFNSQLEVPNAVWNAVNK
jgi:hypothetical protein